MPLKTHLPPNFLFGTAVHPGQLKNNPRYRQILQEEFNLLIPENALKCGWVCQIPNTYNFQSADRVVEFVQQHNQAYP